MKSKSWSCKQGQYILHFPWFSTFWGTSQHSLWPLRARVISWDQLYYETSYISWKVWDCDSHYWRIALPSSDQCFNSSFSFTACISLLVSSQRKVSEAYTVEERLGFTPYWLHFLKSWQLHHRLLHALELVPAVEPIPGSVFPQTMWVPRDSGIALMALQSTVRQF